MKVRIWRVVDVLFAIALGLAACALALSFFGILRP